jgi:hypothetical protein
MTNTAGATLDLTTAGLLASLPHPYETYVHYNEDDGAWVANCGSRFIITLSKSELFWIQDLRHSAVVVMTHDFFAAVKAMLALNIHREDAAAADCYDLAAAILNLELYVG